MPDMPRFDLYERCERALTSYKGTGGRITKKVIEVAVKKMSEGTDSTPHDCVMAVIHLKAKFLRQL